VAAEGDRQRGKVVDLTAEIARLEREIEPPSPEMIEAAQHSGLPANESEALREWAQRVAALPEAERELERENKINVVSVFHKRPARIVDAFLREAGVRKNGGSGKGKAAGAPLALRDPEPWPEPVDGAALLDELAGTFRRYVALPDGAADALALWILHAHTLDAFQVSPRLALTSPEKRCGKTVCLTVLGALVPRPLPASNLTASAVFRSVERYQPTLLIDEGDSFLRDNEELRGVLNSGHTRSMSYVVRTTGDDFEPALFSTWAATAVALIGKLPATLEDRSVVVPMRRRAPEERVERLRLDRLGELEPIRRRAARWAADNREALRTADPDVPELYSDRAADNWRPLLAIADAAGGEWPTRARQAARLLTPTSGEDEDAAGVLLLADLRDLFAERGADRLASEDIIETLRKMEDRPWPEWRHGQPLTTRQLARLLKPFGIGPAKYRSGEKIVRGYLRESFSDPWSRYLKRHSGTCLQNGTFHVPQAENAVADENHGFAGMFRCGGWESPEGGEGQDDEPLPWAVDPQDGSGGTVARHPEGIETEALWSSEGRGAG